MPSRDLFHSPKRLIKRAQEHIRNLEARIKRFFANNPCRHVAELDANRTKEIHKVRLTKPFPDRPGELAYEAAIALRSALDQIGYATAVADGKIKPKSAYFPIADSLPELDNVIKGRCKDIPADIVTFFRTFNPYQGGNDLVWGLNKICNSRHTVLLEPIAMGLDRIHFNRASFRSGTEFFSRWDGENNEIAFAALPIGSNPQYDAEISIAVAFGDVEAVRGQLAAPTLRAMTGEVERIVLATESETMRLGLIS